MAKAESQASGLLLKLASLRERQKRVGGSALTKKERQMLRRQCAAARSGLVGVLDGLSRTLQQAHQVPWVRYTAADVDGVLRSVRQVHDEGTAEAALDVSEVLLPWEADGGFVWRVDASSDKAQRWLRCDEELSLVSFWLGETSECYVQKLEGVAARLQSVREDAARMEPHWLSRRHLWQRHVALPMHHWGSGACIMGRMRTAM